MRDRLSDFFGRPVSIADTPPPNASFDEVWVRELKNGAGPYFDRPSRDEEGDELVDGGTSMSDRGSFANFGAVHLVTTGSTRQLAALAPGSRFDAYRFRPNIVVETPDDGFVETAWQRRALRIGPVRLEVSFTVPRCVMTTVAQGDLPADPDVLRTISEHNSVLLAHGPIPYPCVGVYADVATGGQVGVGDEVTLLD